MITTDSTEISNLLYSSWKSVENRKTFRGRLGIVLVDDGNVLSDVKRHLTQPVYRLPGLGVMVGEDGRHIRSFS